MAESGSLRVTCPVTRLIGTLLKTGQESCFHKRLLLGLGAIAICSQRHHPSLNMLPLLLNCSDQTRFRVIEDINPFCSLFPETNQIGLATAAHTSGHPGRKHIGASTSTKQLAAFGLQVLPQRPHGLVEICLLKALRVLLKICQRDLPSLLLRI